MERVNSLSLRLKLYILLGIIIFGLLFTSALGFFNMNKMKNNLDALYFGSLIPVAELNKIQHIYNKDIAITFYQLIGNQISPAEASEKISLSRKNILSSWVSYTSHFKRDYELDYIQYASSELTKSAHYLKRLSSAVIRLDPQNLSKLSSKTLTDNINEINHIINNILSYEHDIAQFERKMLIQTYHQTLYKLLASLIFIIASAIIIIVPIFSSIQNNQISLLHTSKKLRSVNRRLETASITDALTGLHNRRYFNLVYNRELTRCIRESKSLAFMMLDIDYFKGYNDSYGHLQGDATLKRVAAVMKETLKRPGDYLFRLGGEEFGVLIADIDEDKAYKMAERLRRNVLGLGIEHNKSEINTDLTISIGLVTLIPTQHCEPDNILHKADENLYTAKKEGRNKVVSTELLNNAQESPQSA